MKVHISPTRESEQNEPINDKHGPEYWQVEYLEPAAEEADGYSPSSGIPELEFWKSPDKRPELFVLLRRQLTRRTILHSFILF